MNYLARNESMKKRYNRSSDILLKMLEDKSQHDDLTFRRILQMLGERAFGMALLFFSLPSALPLSAIPGISFVFSLPVIIFAAQMIFIRKTLWLPKIIAEQTISREKVSKIICTVVPYLVRVEWFLKPRLAFMTSRVMEVINGITIFCLALLLMLPIPFSNFIFSALIIFFSLGLIEKDGIFIAAGYVGTVCYIVFAYTFILSMIKIIS